MPNDLPVQVNIPDKPIQKPWGKIMTITLLVVAVLAGGYYGYKYYQKQQDEITSLKAQNADLQKQTAEADMKAQKTTSVSSQATPSDSDQIKAILIAKCGATVGQTAALGTFKIDVQKTSFIQASYLCKGANEGPTVIFKKVGNTWVLIWSGIGPVSDGDRTTYGIPSDIPKY